MERSPFPAPLEESRPPRVPEPPHPAAGERWSRLSRWLESPRLEPLWVLLGIYAVHFALTASRLALSPGLPARTPFPGLPVHVLTGWDGGHYFLLAREWTRYVWPPLYPLALRFLGALFERQGLERAALLLNLVGHVGIVLGAYALVRAHARLRDIPPWLFACLLLFFPGHNVFFASYAESLFLALVLWATVAWLRDQTLRAGLLCGLACLTRLMGFYLGAALLGAEVLRAWQRRRLEWRRLLGLGTWGLFFGGWNLYVVLVGHTTLTAEQAPWLRELIAGFVPPGMDPVLWVLRYITLPGHKEWLYFWAAVAAAGWCFARRFPVGGLFIILFLLSFTVHLYRPFPFSRFVSVLFPVALMAADALKRVPRLQGVVVVLCAVQANLFETLLFLHQLGEP